jgi:hypothetical protein
LVHHNPEHSTVRSCINNVPTHKLLGTPQPRTQYNEHHDKLEISATVTNLGTVNVISGNGEVK